MTIWTKQSDGTQSWIKQVLHYIFYVFTTEQIYSNDGSKVIIYGNSDDYYSKQNDGNGNWKH